jgi:glycosyltransferase involved in cell wall biosynthesis
MGSLIDQIRDVPETAVRLFLGAKCRRHPDGGMVIDMDGKQVVVSEEVFDAANRVARALGVRPRRCEYASDILELRHDAEGLFLEEFADSKGLPQILFCPAGEIASAWYRAMIPADTMCEQGLAVAHHTGRLDLSKALRYQVLWIQLATSKFLLTIAKTAQKEGVKVVYDFDDAFWCIPDDNPAAQVYVDTKKNEVWEMIEMADLVSVSTPALADRVRDRAKGEVRVLPNMIPVAIWPQAKPHAPGVFRILYSGSPTHLRDLQVAAPALRRVLERGEGKVKLVCFGQRPPAALEGLSEDLIEMKDFVDFQAYPDALAKIGADLMVSPLEVNEFNACKSAIKCLEAGGCGYPILTSPVGEYPVMKREGAPITLVEDGEWDVALSWAISNPNPIKESGQELRKWVLENRCVIKTGAAPWLQAAKDLIGNSHE